MRTTILDVLKALLLVLIPLTSFTTGLQSARQSAGQSQLAHLWQRPGQLFRDLLAILVLVPLWALILVAVVPVSPVVRGGLLIAVLAVGIGPVAGMKRMGSPTPAAREALDLNLVVLLISLVFVPLAFAGMAALFHRDLHISVGAVAKVVLGRALVPLLLGLGAARLWPRFAVAVGPVLAKVINIVLLAVLVVALIATWKRLADVGGVGWLVAAAVALGAVVIGHLLGGPDRASRGVVAAGSAMRFPALALALAAVMPLGHLLIPVVVVYVVASLLILAAYGAIMGRRERKREASTPLHAAHVRP